MSRRLSLWIAAVSAAVGVGVFAWLWFAGGSGEPSAELTTPTIAGSDATVGDADTTPADDSATAYVIDSTRSEASFEIDEELRGEPQRVVGTTSEVAGQVSVEPSDLSTVQISDIVINARTFQTDSDRRDRAIRGPIVLDSASDEFELITFSVTSIDGLGGSVDPGDIVEFTVTGDLAIKDTTNEVTFDVSATFADESMIEGSATTTVLRSGFGIGIPSVPGVANVGDEVTLNLVFVAVAG